MKVYLDSNIVSYLVTQPAGFGARATAHVMGLVLSGDQLVVSDLVRLECRSSPLGTGNMRLLADYDRFFTSLISETANLTTAVCDRAAHIRGTYRFKVPDSIHLAAAIESHCDAFLTNDLRLRRFSDIRVDLLP